MPEDDIVHSRLTHSLEVASVGRSLGKKVGVTVRERAGLSSDARDFGDIVAAACLAHDIGNPPFGHAGEDAIAAYFRSDEAQKLLKSLNHRERSDLETFEGNAQGFRIITRLQLEGDTGLRLTAATLGAFCKYPREVAVTGGVHGASGKKFGVFQAEMPVMRAVAGTVGLRRNHTASGEAWHRHPLAFLMEAADDICYSILDIEDGVRLKHVEAQEAIDRLHAIACKVRNFDRGRPSSSGMLCHVGYLRALAISCLVGEVVEVFLSLENDIISSSYDEPLCDRIPSSKELAALKELARKCYCVPGVLEIELTGYEVLGRLLALFVGAVVAEDRGKRSRPVQERKAYELLISRGALPDCGTLYERVLRVADYVSGMTDRHALSTYRRLFGVALPSSAVR